MDEIKQKYDEADLHSKPYRVLQRITKEMSLPSNVKKVQLVNLILSNIYGPIEKVKTLIAQVKKDRARQAQLRKRTIKRKAKETLPTNSSRSQLPIITATPKFRPNILRRVVKPITSQDGNARNQFAYKLQPQFSIDQSEDRKPKEEQVPNSQANGKQNGHLLKYQHMNTTTYYNNAKVFKNKMVLRKRDAKGKHQELVRNNLMPVSVKQTIQHVTHGSTRFKGVTVASSYRPSGSGIEKKTAREIIVKKTTNEIDTSLNKAYTYKLIPGGISLTNKNGVVSKIQAYAKQPRYTIDNSECNQKKTRKTFKPKSMLNTDQTSTQDIDNQKSTQNSVSSQTKIINEINYNNNDSESHIQNQSIISQNNNNQNIISQNNNNQNTISENINSQSSFPEAEVNELSINTTYMDTPMSIVFQGQGEGQNGELVTNEEITDYFHKKIQAESMRPRRANIEQRITRSEEDGRPSVSPNVTQPFCVCCANDNTGPTVFNTNRERSSYLETYNNLPIQYLYEPVLQRCTTTSGTACVYSAPVYTTAKLHFSTVDCYVQANLAPYVQQYEYNIISQQCMNNFVQTAGQDVGIQNRYSTTDIMYSSCSANRSELPDMVADAFEIITQDEDYMEQMGMDVTMQCVLCSWSGPRIILENHILQKHSNLLRSVNNEEWRFECNLSLQPQLELLQTRHGAIFIANLRLRLDNTLEVAFASVADYDIPARGSITVCNILTGQLYAWEGDIPKLSPNFINEPHSSNCFVIPMSQLDQMPANLNPNNGWLDSNLVGVHLNDIAVELFFKILT